MRNTASFTLAIAALLLAMFIASCGGRRVPQPRPVRTGYTETGLASWYGVPFHGRRAANGEIFDMHEMTAAHKSMPFGTIVEVRNLRNDKSVRVRITDRGPFVDGRIIDLSFGAAREIDMIGSGVDRVRLRVITPGDGKRVRQQVATSNPAPPVPQDTPPRVSMPAGSVQEVVARRVPEPANESAPTTPQQVERYAVQVASFRVLANAEALRDKLAAEFEQVRILPTGSDPIIYRLVVGSGTRDEMDTLREVLLPRYRDSLITRLP